MGTEESTARGVKMQGSAGPSGRVYWEGIHTFQCSDRGPLASPLGCVHREARSVLQQPPYNFVKETCDTNVQPEFTFTTRKVSGNPANTVTGSPLTS